MSFHFWNFPLCASCLYHERKKGKMRRTKLRSITFKTKRKPPFSPVVRPGRETGFRGSFLPQDCTYLFFLDLGNQKEKKKSQGNVCLLIYHVINNRCNVSYIPKKKEIVKQKIVNCKFLSIQETLSSQELA